MTRKFLETAACLSASLAIGAGAFGAHGVQGAPADWLKTGASYALVHAVAAFAAAGRYPRSASLLLAGSLVFSFSLYALALGGPRLLGAVAPLGGATMILGWLSMAYRASSSRNSSTSASDTDLST